MALPHARCNWLIDDKVLLGAAPRKEDFSQIVECGIDVFVNLQVTEEWYVVEYPNLTCIHFPIKNGRAGSLNETVKLVDKLLKMVKDGSKLYIHCRGGHGRAGTIGALMVGKLNNMNCNEAVEVIERKRETRIDKSRNFIPTPESTKQIKLIASILGGDTPLPDRSDRSWLARVRREGKN